MTDETAWLDATAQASLVRSGAATPGELVDAALARVAALNPQLNAVIFDRSEKARAEAAGPPPDGPFRGVPMLLKDAVAHTAGDPYHCGMRALKEAGWVEHEDTWLVERFRAAGFVIIGKTNTPELASAATTEPLAYGPTHNPWDLDRSPGGSSGGSAAAVAAGMVAVAHGNDMGGSIRMPSSMCGLVGLKPSRARGTLGPEYGEYWGMTTHEHVLTRTVRDTAGVLDVIAGAATGDPYTAPAPARPFAAEVGADPGRLRIGFRIDAAHLEPFAAGAAAVRTAAEQLEALGHVVEPAVLPALDAPDFGEAVGVMIPVWIGRELDRWAERLGRSLGPDDIEPWNATLGEAGRAVPAPMYVAAIEKAQRWARRVAAWWTDHDLLLTPTVTAPTPPLGYVGPTAELTDMFSRMGALVGFSMPFNVTGQPAISLPLTHAADGMPVGVQLVGAYGREDVLLRVASQLEAAHPWHDRHPPVAAP
ncbi:MAG TPA: amidase [Acidimicrobiia bacterium]|nr:amidase [Acidimicrobiia bacterium]